MTVPGDGGVFSQRFSIASHAAGLILSANARKSGIAPTEPARSAPAGGSGAGGGGKAADAGAPAAPPARW
jgi:hypothetical protein